MFLFRWNEWVHRRRAEAGRIASLLPAVAATTLFATCQSASASSCLVQSIPRGESRANVKLLESFASPYLYFRSIDYNFAVLAAPSVVHDALAPMALSGNKDARELLTLLEADMPLKNSTDLFKYVLKDSYQLSTIQRTLVAILARGEVAVFDAETGQLAKTVTVKRVNSDRIRSRTFYTSNKTVLLQSLDCIAN